MFGAFILVVVGDGLRCCQGSESGFTIVICCGGRSQGCSRGRSQAFTVAVAVWVSLSCHTRRLFLSWEDG